ncbi:uncharacterized protein [Pocillopora verrucosa]|uniref:uncharacterized protein n=1 Tax=Pocillopora verrucosa TaxID=203993 RepID=UPI00279778ED|nr:uncharacterized protein LOC131771572 [Pocillopora verrucosa]
MGMTSGHAIAAITIGTLQSLFSVILIITSFVLLSYGHGVKTSITPYWSGFPFFICGIFGFAGGVTKKHCCMVTFLVFSIITAIISAAASITVTLALSYWDIAVDLSDCTTLGGSCYCLDGISYGVDDCSYLKSIRTVIIVVMFVCYISFALAVTGSILGCITICYAPPDPPMMVIAQPTMAPTGMVVSHSSMQVSGGAPMAYCQGAYSLGAYPQGTSAGQAMFTEQTAETHDKASLFV